MSVFWRLLEREFREHLTMWSPFTRNQCLWGPGIELAAMTEEQIRCASLHSTLTLVFLNVVYSHSKIIFLQVNISVKISISNLSLSELYMQVNTFQVVIATDSLSSYVIFLYSDLQWYIPITSSGSGSGIALTSSGGSGR